MSDTYKPQESGDVFALDIGTRSIIGVLGRVENGRLFVQAIEKENHGQRAMLDGQIEDIGKVAAVARIVVDRLEKRTQTKLSRVSVAAAGRALRSEKASFTLGLNGIQQINDDMIGQLEAGAVSEAERTMSDQPGRQDDRFYMVGYSVSQYRLDGYPMSNLKNHSGKVLEADVVATFLPQEVVESLYAVVAEIGLEVASLTLEPIASLNAAIPADIRLLNLVLVDIGAGTSDIAACRDGSVVGYTMATIAGDEITELLMRKLLVDFQTGESLKMDLEKGGTVHYVDILGLPHDIGSEQLLELIAPATQSLAKEIAARVLDLNGKVPSAVFLAGGGSKLQGLRERVSEELKIDLGRVAIAGNHFGRNAYSEEYDLNDPEYATPLGIAISAGLGLINDSYVVLLNGDPAKLFRSGVLILRDILLMNGYHYSDLMGRTGANLSIMLNGERQFFRGAPSTPPEITLNGETAALSAVVHAGDSIQFKPAAPGADASKTIGDLIGDPFRGEVYVNGVAAALSSKVHTGDEIWVYPAPEEARSPTPSAASPTPSAEPSSLPRADTAPTKPTSRPQIRSGHTLTIRLNGQSIQLPAKPDREVHYLMDALEYSGLDFAKLDKPVELRVNGVPGQFTQVLRENDEVIIE